MRVTLLDLIVAVMEYPLVYFPAGTYVDWARWRLHYHVMVPELQLSAYGQRVRA